MMICFRNLFDLYLYNFLLFKQIPLISMAISHSKVLYHPSTPLFYSTFYYLLFHSFSTLHHPFISSSVFKKLHRLLSVSHPYYIQMLYMPFFVSELHQRITFRFFNFIKEAYHLFLSFFNFFFMFKKNTRLLRDSLKICVDLRAEWIPEWI